MECMQAKALRASLRGEELSDNKVEEVYYNTTTHTVVSCVSPDDSLVDEFLNLQNLDFEHQDRDHHHHRDCLDDDDDEKFLSLEDDNSNLSFGFSDSPLASELAVPDDDIAELEWVSHFVYDSLSEFSLLHPLNKPRADAWRANRSEPERNRSEPARFPSVPVKPRTKRSRPGATRSPSLSPHSESSSATTTSSSSSSSSSTSPPPPSFLGFPASFLFPNHVQVAKTGGEPEKKRKKRKLAVQDGSLPAGPQFMRRCSHCQVQKTPQWRTGPLGAKTLCNACGVRFKSGRLFPEYRPACSPTFSSDVHSNSHRKVVEMRKRKGVSGPGSGLTQIISSF